MRARRALAVGVALGVLLPAHTTRAGYSAATNYILHCQGCHGADGVGAAPGEIPPLTGYVGYFLRVPGGRAYLTRVPGVAQAPVSDAELAHLLNYVVERFGALPASAAFPPYSAEEVARERRRGGDIVAERRGLAAAIRSTLGIEVWVDPADRP